MQSVCNGQTGKGWTLRAPMITQTPTLSYFGISGKGIWVRFQIDKRPRYDPLFGAHCTSACPWLPGMLRFGIGGRVVEIFLCLKLEDLSRSRISAELDLENVPIHKGSRKECSRPIPMSMLRNLHRPQAWNTSGYVCRSCRLQIEALQCQQPRWQSSTAPTQETADDWMSNFNGISVEHSTPTDIQNADDAVGVEGEGANDGLRSGKKRRPKTKREQMAAVNNFANLKNTLTHRLPKEPADIDRGNVASGQELSSGAKSSSRKLAEGKLSSNRSAAQRNHRRERRRDSEVLREDEDMTVNHGERTDVPVETFSVKNSESNPQCTKFESLVDFLTKVFTDSLPGMLQKFKKNEEQEPAQAASESKLGVASSEFSKRVARPNLVSETTSSSSSSSSRPRTHISLRNQRSPAQMVRDSRDWPKWGGAVATSSGVGIGTPRLGGVFDNAESGSIVRKIVGEGEDMRRVMPERDRIQRQLLSVYRRIISVDADSPADPAEVRIYRGGKNDGAATEDAGSGTEKPSGSQGATITSLKDSLSSKFQKSKKDSEIFEGSTGFHERLAAVTQNVDYYKSPLRPRENSAPAVNTDVNGEQSRIDRVAGRLASLHSLHATTSETVDGSDIEDKKATDVPDGETKDVTRLKTPKTGRRKGRPIRKLKQTEEMQKVGGTTKRSRKIRPKNLARALNVDDPQMGTGDVVDGDSKPLWQVMADAKAVAESPAKSAEPENSTEQPEPTAMDVVNSEIAKVVFIQPADLRVEPLNIPQPAVPGLEYGLDRVLFNPGVYQLQDPLSRVYNFDPYLQKIMPVTEFEYNALKEYKTSSQDTALSTLAKEHGKRYIGSTSSMTSTLGHFHYLLSHFRELNFNMLSRGFLSQPTPTFTNINRAPNAMFLRWKNGVYAIDADKEYDGANVLMMLGKSMEKLLTMKKSDYERYRKTDPRSVSEEERTSPESYEYTTMNNFLMRSQLDAHDSRLPGTGTFDLKTRAVLSVRMNAEDFQPMTGYEIQSLHGRFGSYEREYYDMIRSTMLKYMLQVRMGRMDGIFIAYHNVERIFGFQYVPLQEMDRAIHGQVHPCLGEQEFKTSLELTNKVLDKATEKFPEQSLRFHFETAPETLFNTPTSVMWIYAEPMAEAEIDRIQNTSKVKITEFERTMMGMEKDAETSVEAAAAADADVDTNDAEEPVDEAAAGQVEAGQATQENPERSDADADAREEAASSQPEHTASNSSADGKFIKTIQSAESPKSDRKQLFVASLIVKSRVNGSSVDRPENLKPGDKWEVEYLLQEWEPNDKMWAKYEQTKARRRELFQRYREEEQVDGEGNGNGEKKRKDGFLTLLREMSQRGRDFRGKMDELEAGKAPVVVGQPLHRAREEEV